MREILDWKARIAKAKAEIADPVTSVVNVEVAGEMTEIGFRELDPDLWLDLVATHPARKGSDVDTIAGYNVDAIAKAYPVEAITIDGDVPEVEDWADQLAVVSSPGRKFISSAIFYVNQGMQAQRMAEAAGKASAGKGKRKSASPAS